MSKAMEALSKAGVILCHVYSMWRVVRYAPKSYVAKMGYLFAEIDVPLTGGRGSRTFWQLGYG